MRRARLVLAGCLAALVAAPAVRAQTTGSIPVTADVDNTALAAATVTNLAFGTVTPGTPVTIDPQSASAASVQLQGASKAEISMTWTLPTTLSTGPGGYTMPISFSAVSGCYDRQGKQNKCTKYDPHTVLTGKIRNQTPPDNSFNVWLGGTVSPAVGQRSGVYRGTITLTAVYTGN